MYGAANSTKSSVTGRVRYIKFQSEKDGYSCLSFEPLDDFNTITAVGVLPEVKEGLEVELHGEWKQHPKHGKQFNFSGYSIPNPKGREGTIAYLETLDKVGEVLAERIWQ